eukprot:EG_transcript_53971
MTMPWRADRVLQWLQMAARYSRAWGTPQCGLRSSMCKRSVAICDLFCAPSSLHPSLPWINLATVATVAQHQSSDATSGTTASVGAPSGGRRALHRLPNVAVQVHLEGY